MNKRIYVIFCVIFEILLFQQNISLSQAMTSIAGNVQVTPANHHNNQLFLSKLLNDYEKQFKVYFTFESNLIKNQIVKNDFKVSGNLEDNLNQVLTPLSLKYTKVSDKYYTISQGLLPKKNKGNLLIESRLSVSLEDKMPVKITISGTVTDENGVKMAGVSVLEKNTSNGTISDNNGNYSISVLNENSILTYSFIGYSSQEVGIGKKDKINIKMLPDVQALTEVVVVGYSTKTKESLTGSISTVTSKDIENVHGGSTVSSSLAGKISGVTFKMPDGRPGASANIQIRNMGTPLYVIDGIQQDGGQFNNLAPNDIESITILKDASAAIYGVRAANGVVLVTTKSGKLNQETRINIDAYTGGQNWTSFPTVLNNSYDFMQNRAAAEVTTFGSTSITQAELEKYRNGEAAGAAYRSFNWKDFIINSNAPQTSLNANVTGGSDKVNYYLSATNLYQNSVLGREYLFNRTNIQSNLTAQITKRLKVGVQINGRIETRENPGVPGGDDYNLARQALYINTPLDRPFANDNPNYLKDNGNKTNANWAFLNYKISGKYKNDWRVLQSNFSAEYQIPGIEGLTVKGFYSYYLADYILNNHEYTFNAYTYRPETQIYDRTNGSTNPWREREQIKQINTTGQLQFNYYNKFGDHTIGGTFVAERLYTTRLRNWIHAVPTTNALPLIYFPTADRYDDSDDQTARLGYVGKIDYNYADKYYIELSARRDASYLFAADKRVGYFPGISVGWRITNERFMKKFLNDKTDILSDLKFRASYGILGDDRNPNDSNSPLVRQFGYLEGYNYNQGTAILGNAAVVGSADAGVPVTNISWLRSEVKNFGIDYSLFNRKLSGSFDFFYRKRDGLLASKTDIVVPTEIGYSLPQENLNSDSQGGGEMSLAYSTSINQVKINIGGNISYSRSKNVDFYKPSFNNSWDQYRNSGVNRYKNINWGYEVVGQFESQEQINNYPTNIDGRGNRTLLPGDLIYKDQNNDGKIDDYDQRPIGLGLGTQPNINYGINLGLAYKNFDLNIDFSGASGYTWNQNWETRWAFQNNGNLNTIFLDSWKRTDIYDVNSAWIPGKYPTNRYNVGTSHSNYGPTSSFWLHDVTYLRLRTLALGYTLPVKILSKAKIRKMRIYVNTYNLLSFDNLKKYGVDPEVQDDNGLQFPQNKFVNVGINLSL